MRVGGCLTGSASDKKMRVYLVGSGGLLDNFCGKRVVKLPQHPPEVALLNLNSTLSQPLTLNLEKFERTRWPITTMYQCSLNKKKLCLVIIPIIISFLLIKDSDNF